MKILQKGLCANTDGMLKPQKVLLPKIWIFNLVILRKSNIAMKLFVSEIFACTNGAEYFQTERYEKYENVEYFSTEIMKGNTSWTVN